MHQECNVAIPYPPPEHQHPSVTLSSPLEYFNWKIRPYKDIDLCFPESNKYISLMKGIFPTSEGRQHAYTQRLNCRLIRLYKKNLIASLLTVPSLLDLCILQKFIVSLFKKCTKAVCFILLISSLWGFQSHNICFSYVNLFYVCVIIRPAQKSKGKIKKN